MSDASRIELVPLPPRPPPDLAPQSATESRPGPLGKVGRVSGRAWPTRAAAGAQRRQLSRDETRKFEQSRDREYEGTIMDILLINIDILKCNDKDV